MTARNRQFAAGLIALAVCSIASGEDVQPLFQDSAAVKAVLTAPIAQVYAQKDLEDRIYFPGKFSYIDSNGNTRRLDVSIRTRGNFRNEHCDLPPLRINFKKKQVEGTLFEGQDKVKLVDPCFKAGIYQRYVILEYLAYQILGILTDYSFKTRLLRLSYVDSDEVLQPWTAVTFMIEDEDAMAERLGMSIIEKEVVSFRELDRPSTALAELFQLLIGNNDYSVIRGGEGEFCCHNAMLLAADEQALKVPVPFDFDFSGLVGAVYALPPSHLPIEDVRMRYYAGLCHPPGVLEDAVAHIQERRADIMALLENLDELNSKEKRAAEIFLNGFFSIVDSPKRVQREIKSRCRGEELLDLLIEKPTDPT